MQENEPALHETSTEVLDAESSDGSSRDETMAEHFARDYYLSLYPDVRHRGIDAFAHFVKQGWREGRRPSPWFDTSYYLEANPDVRDANVNPFWHYLAFGRHEGRRATWAPGADNGANRRLLRCARRSMDQLDHNNEHVFARNYALKIYPANAVYSLIPKNACSTLRLSIGVANGCLRDERDAQWIHKNNETFKATLQDLALATYTFVVLRDPFARLVSCFLNKIVDREVPAWIFKDAVSPIEPLENLCFETFVEGLKYCALALDEHWRPQSDFLVYETYDAYFALESFDHAKRTLAERIGLHVLDARPLTAHGLDRFVFDEGEDFSRVPISRIADMKREGRAPHPRSLLSKRAIRDIAMMYGNDFDLYVDKIGRPLLCELP